MTMLSVISSYSHNDVTTGSVADPDLQISAGGGGGVAGCSLRDKEGCRSYIYIHTYMFLLLLLLLLLLFRVLYNKWYIKYFQITKITNKKNS